MKIKYVSEDGLAFLRNNAGILYKTVVQNREKSLVEFMSDSGMLRETPFEIEEFTLDTGFTAGQEPLSDAENAQRVYLHMKSLSDSQASDERIWVAYTLQEQIDYMRYRWKCSDTKSMLNRYFFNYSGNRSLFRNGMSRLWWIARVTYDEKNVDPFVLTKYLCGKQDLIENICGRSVFNNRTIQKATIRVMYEEEKKGRIVKREDFRELAKYVNLLGGTYLLDILDENEIYEKVQDKLESLMEM